MKVIRIRNSLEDKAKMEILNYPKEKKEADTFDIANDLRLDLNFAIWVLKELWEEGRIS